MSPHKFPDDPSVHDILLDINNMNDARELINFFVLHIK